MDDLKKDVLDGLAIPEVRVTQECDRDRLRRPMPVVASPDDGDLGIGCPQCHGWGTEGGIIQLWTRCVVCGEKMDGDEQWNGTGMCESCAWD